MHYLAFPTVTRSTGEGTIKGPPFEVYAISGTCRDTSFTLGNSMLGVPPYFRITGVNDGELVLEQITNHQVLQRLRKWVEKPGVYNKAQRRIMNIPEASVHVSEEEVIRILSGQD